MKILQESVLSKMTFQRLKAHRTSVLAHIDSKFFETELAPGCDCTDCRKRYGVRNEVNHDTPEYEEAISYRNLVNKYYDSAKENQS